MNRLLLIFFIVLLLFTVPVKSQHILCNNIPVLNNFDSLENVLQNQTIDKNDRVLSMLIFIKSKVAYGLPIKDSYFKTLDTLANDINNKNAIIINNLFELKINIDNGLHKDRSIEIGNKLLTDFASIKDTSGILYTYYLLAKANVKGIGTFPGAENLLVNNYINNAQRLANAAPTAYNKLLLLLSKSQADCISLKGINDIQLYNEAKKIISQNKQFQYFLYYFKTYYTYSLIVNKNKITEALNIYLDLEKELSLNVNSILLASVYYNIGNSYSISKNFALSNTYTQKALDIINKHFPTALDLIWNCTQVKAKNLHAQKNYEAAWLTKEQADSILQVKLQLEREYNFRALQTQYQTEIKQRENIKLIQQRKWSIVGISITILLLVFIVLLFLKTKQQNTKLILLNNFKNKIHTIISHDFRSPLIGLTQLYEQYNYWTKKNDPKEIEKLSNSIDEAANNMNNLLNNILLWTTEIKTKQQQLIVLYNTTNNVLVLYKNLLQTQNIAVQNNVMQQHKIIANNNVLELIIRNWIDNVIKHAKPSEILFYTQQLSNGGIVFFIEDNGNLDEKNYSKIQAFLNNQQVDINNTLGLGLSLMNEFATKEKWKIQLVQTNNKNIFSITF